MTATAPQVDHVTVPGVGDYAGHSIAISVSCELMKNQLPGTDIAVTTDTAVVQDSAGRPMLFTIGSDSHLRLLATESATATGFTVTDLVEDFAGYSGATAFDVSQDLSGRITVAAALTRADGSGTDIVIAPVVSDDVTQTDWSQFYRLAPKVDGVDPKFVASRIQIGSSDGGNEPFTIAIGAIDGQEYYYRIDAPSSPARKLEFPENVPTSGAGSSMSIGFAFGDRATWFLYSAGQSVTLEATTLPSDGGKSLTYDYSPGYTPSPGAPIPGTLKYNCVATPTGANADSASISSDVYVGSDTGVYLFRGAHAGLLSTVADGLKDVHQLFVTQDAANISVWALCSPSQLYYIYGKKGPAYAWNTPILFNPSVIHIAPMRNKALQANELFVVNQDESVTHHWQDPGTTLWQQRTLSVPKSGYVFDAATFTTTIHVEDDAGNPLPGKTLDVTASEWFYATANGLVYSIDKDNPAALVTDGMGAVTLIAMTADIAPPIVHVTSSIFDKVVNIYPNGAVQKALAAVKSGSDLKNAKTADGQPVVDPSTPQSTCDGVAANMAVMTGTAVTKAPGLGADGNTFVVVEDSARHTGTLEIGGLPRGAAIAMTVRNGVWQQHPEPAALMASFGIEDIFSWPGDALHWLENAFDDAIDYVKQGVTFLQDGASFVLREIEDGFEIALKFGSTLLRFALTTIGAVFKALNWLLKLVGIDLKMILAWLGHLFGWDDIWDTHKVLASMMRTGIDYAVSRGSAEIEQLRQIVADTFATAKQQLSDLVLAPGDADIKPKTQDLEQRSTPVSITARSSPGSFSQYQVQHSGMLEGSTLSQAEAPERLAAFLHDTVTPAIMGLVNDLEKDLDDIANLCRDPGSTVAEAKKLAVRLADKVLDPVSQIVDALFQFVEPLLKRVRSALEEEFEIPFLTEFYEFITDLLGDGEDFTVINGLALLLSIPLVELWKAATGSAPFADSSYGLGSPTLFEQFAPGGAPALTPGIRATALTADEADDPEPSQADQDYSRYGGGIAALAGMAGAVFELTWLADGKEPDSAKKIGLALGTARSACTFPVPVKSGDVAWRLRLTSWALSTMEVVVNYFIDGEPLKGGLNGSIDTVILILSLVADGLDSPGPLGWATDVISNGSAPVRGFGAAAKEEYSTATGTAFGVIGAGLGVGDAAAGLAPAAIYYLLNVGG
jgi:hypothetical protein